MVIVQGHRGCDVVAVGEQVGLLRECLDLEFRAGHLPFQYSLERVIDDFVLFCMLIGNDFLPRERPSAHRPFGAPPASRRPLSAADDLLPFALFLCIDCVMQSSQCCEVRFVFGVTNCSIHRPRYPSKHWLA